MTDKKTSQFKAAVTRKSNAVIQEQIKAFEKKTGRKIDEKTKAAKTGRYEKLKDDALIEAMQKLDVNPDFIDNFKKFEPSNKNNYLAQYAVDKVIRIVKSYADGDFMLASKSVPKDLKEPGIDHYTGAILYNAIVNDCKTYQYKDAAEAITAKAPIDRADGYHLKFTLSKDASTASTQVSSSTRALSAIGAARIDASNKSATLNLKHPVIVGCANYLMSRGVKVSDKFLETVTS